MSPDKQNVAIAEALGYTRGVGMNGLEWWTNSEGVHDEPPYYDYVTSLDAMHAAEKVLTDEQQFDYACWLDQKFASSSCEFSLLHATAAQRAEAFLRTLGKWEDDK